MHQYTLKPMLEPQASYTCVKEINKLKKAYKTSSLIIEVMLIPVSLEWDMHYMRDNYQKATTVLTAGNDIVSFLLLVKEKRRVESKHKLLERKGREFKVKFWSEQPNKFTRFLLVDSNNCSKQLLGCLSFCRCNWRSRRACYCSPPSRVQMEQE